MQKCINALKNSRVKIFHSSLGAWNEKFTLVHFLKKREKISEGNKLVFNMLYYSKTNFDIKVINFYLLF